MYCPRCGADNQEGDRFCANCGRALPGTSEAARERRSLRDSVRQVVGTSPRARLITGATLAALALAIVAFLALDPAEDSESTDDAYTLAADDVCVDAKKEIAVASRRAAGQGPGRAAAELVPIVATWRSDLGALHPPADSAGQARALDTALRDVEIDAGAVARTAREGNQEALGEAAGRLNARTGQVEEAIAELGLSRCSRVVVGPSVEDQR